MNSVANPRLSCTIDVAPESTRSLRLSPVPVARFDEYVVVARLGRGGMAEVILGLAQGPSGFRKLVAIKRLHPHCEEDPELVRMFLHEAALAALLSHPNVVQTYKVGSAEGHHFIAMEYLEGQPLHRVFSRLTTGGVGVNPALAARIARDALAGLEHAHEARDYDGTPLGLVHRDVSPQNLFITYDGQVKLLDFGIAKAASYGMQTRPGLIKGKLGYMAPEQAEGHADARADVWSVGVILWESLAGRRLFRGNEEVAVLRAVLRREIPPLAKLSPQVPLELARIVERALTRDRDARYSCAREMKEELSAWLTSAADAELGDPLAHVMQQQFADAITERREAVRECLATIEHEQRWQALVQGQSDGRDEVNAAPVTPAADTMPRTKIQVALLFAALLALVAIGLSQVFSAPSPHTKPRHAQVAAGLHGEERAADSKGRKAKQTESQIQGAPLVASPSAEISSAQPSSGDAGAAPSAPRRADAHRPGLPSTSQRDLSRPPQAVSAFSRATTEGERATRDRAVPETGRLRLDSIPYAVVKLVGGRRLGITPIDVELPAAVHLLSLRNPERGIETTYRVQIVAGESLARRIELE